MKQHLIIANWKCNPPTFKEAVRLFEAAEENAKNVKNVEIVICAPNIYLSAMRPPINPSLSKGGKKGGVILGAQDCFWERQGAYTGEVSAAMLKDVGCEYIIIGHSERRKYFGETDEIISKKLKAALSVGMKPIFCAGEEATEKEQMKSVLEKQLAEGLKDVKPNQIANVVIAYEPVWAISTSGGEYCTPDYAFSAGLVIRKFLINNYGKYGGNKIKIIYGGSVDGNSAALYIKEAKMDGVLVGAASLKEEEFGKIIKNISEISN